MEHNNRSHPAALADIAQCLAEKEITGSKTDPNFLPILAYYTNGKRGHDRKALRDLKSGWCAAFVYHCCVQAGYGLPPRVMCREKERNFSAVIAWFEWGERMGFLHQPEDFTPQRGDIVIYKWIIPEQHRQKGSLWHDHIGIVLASSNTTITAAEGNIDNCNKGGIIVRKRDAHIGCFLRLPEGWTYTD